MTKNRYNTLRYERLTAIMTAKDNLHKYLRLVSREFYMKDIPLHVVKNILMLNSAVIIALDNYRGFEDYGVCN